jgi:hypothetical protein
VQGNNQHGEKMIAPEVGATTAINLNAVTEVVPVTGGAGEVVLRFAIC